MTAAVQQIARRRTFAIISHPDAGKTTLTEKLLWFGGAIQVAGEIRARKAARHATSDWMELEKQRGISVTSSVMSFVILWAVVFTVTAVGGMFFGLDFLTAMSGTAAAMANVGPGLGEVIGPSGNYASIPDGAKWLFIFAMIAGRLELFTVLVLFSTAFWRD